MKTVLCSKVVYKGCEHWSCIPKGTTGSWNMYASPLLNSCSTAHLVLCFTQVLIRRFFPCMIRKQNFTLPAHPPLSASGFRTLTCSAAWASPYVSKKFPWMTDPMIVKPLPAFSWDANVNSLGYFTCKSSSSFRSTSNWGLEKIKKTMYFLTKALTITHVKNCLSSLILCLNINSETFFLYHTHSRSFT